MSTLSRSQKHSSREANGLGSGTDFGVFNYAGEARERFRNFVIETWIMRVAGFNCCFVGSFVFLC